MMKRLLIAAAIAAAGSAFAAEIPEPGAADARIRYVTYKKDDVTVVKTRRGAVTRIILEDNEQITVAGTGFPSDCAKAELEWCVVATVGTNQIWIKPKDGATHNNLELKTNKRDYSFEFRVLADAEQGRGKKPPTSEVLTAEPMFRVIFRYPVQMPSMSSLMAINSATFQMNEQNVLKNRIEATKPIPQNWKYTMQVLEGADDIAPSLVFDDGRFTYFKFSNNREVPSIFYISANEEEARINYHMEGDLAVVQRMGRRFVLRLGQSVVGVWNEALDPDGVAPKDGTTIEGVKRVVKDQQ